MMMKHLYATSTNSFIAITLPLHVCVENIYVFVMDDQIVLFFTGPDFCSVPWHSFPLCTRYI